MSTRSLLAAAVFVPLVVAASREARADDTIKRPGDHPNYTFEIEPHAVIGWDDIYATGGFGAGVRVSIPLVQNGFIPTINNSVAITFGAELIRYDACYYSGFCGAWYLEFPVAMQWNFFVAQRWSVFGELGLFVSKGFFDGCSNITANLGCSNPSEFGLRPALYVGGRYHVNDRIAVTMRIWRYPTVSVGASFF